jgi:ABC-type amino acid transport substrate-binding protein
MHLNFVDFESKGYKFMLHLCGGATQRKLWLIFFLCISLNTAAVQLTVGTENIDYFPHYRFDGGDDQGYIWAVLQAFAKQSGHTMVYVAYPIKRLHQELLDNNIDFLYPDNPKWISADRQQQSKYFSKPIITAFGSTVVLPERVNQGLKNFKSLAVPHGFTSIMYASLIAQRKVSLLEVPDAISALQMVLKGRVDGADVELNVAQHLLEQLAQPYALVFDPSLPFDPVTFHLSTIEHPDIIKQLDDFIDNNQVLISKLKAQYQLKEPVAGYKPDTIEVSN